MRKSTAPTDRTADLLTQLTEGCAALESSEGWQRWLETASKFYRYSFGNQLLIMLQRPDATQVAGFHKWLEFQRHVNAGERGIRILAPCVVKRRETDKETGEESARKALIGFRGTVVFDVSQTSGQDLPERPGQRLTGDAPVQLVAKLLRYANRLEFTVEFEAKLPGETNGDCSPLTKRIRVSRGLDPAQVAKTLTHELGHAIMHNGDPLSKLPRAQLEVEAESVAYLVLGHEGIDSAAYSFSYVAGWARGESVSAASAIQASGQRIVKTAQTITDAIGTMPQ